MKEKNKEEVNLIMGGYDPMPVLNALSVCASARNALLNLHAIDCEKPLSKMTMGQVSHLANCGHQLNQATFSALMNKTAKKERVMPRSVMEYSVELELKALKIGVSEHLRLAKKSKEASLTERNEKFHDGCISAYGNVLSRVEDIMKKMECL